MNATGICGIRGTRSRVGEIRLKLGGVVVVPSVLETLVVVLRDRSGGGIPTDAARMGIIVSVVAYRGCINSRVIGESDVMGFKSDIIRSVLIIRVMVIRSCISRGDIGKIVIIREIVVYRRNVRKIIIRGNATPFSSSWWG